MKPNPLPFLREKWTGVPPPTAPFTGKTIIIAGANLGLGFESAAIFTALDAAKVILAVRNITKGDAAKQQIEDRNGRKGVVEVWELDMDRFASIESFTKRVEQELPRLDVAVLNAGAMPKEYTLTAEGFETMLQINVVGTALLGLLLLPKLKASKSSERDTPHLVIVTSESHRWVEEKDIPDPSPYGGNLLLAVNAAPKGSEKFRLVTPGSPDENLRARRRQRAGRPHEEKQRRGRRHRDIRLPRRDEVGSHAGSRWIPAQHHHEDLRRVVQQDDK